MALFSFFQKSAPALLVFHDQRLTLLQFEVKNKAYDLVGFNEIELDDGIVQKGEIVSMDQFQYALSDLFSKAEPNAVKANELWVNIPYHLLYTFVEDFSHKSKKTSLEASMLANVREHSPISAEELSLEYHSIEKGHKVTYAAYASPKKWQARLLKVCKKIGITSINFIPEPVAHMALSAETNEADFALFSFHEGQTFLSIFHNGLIYDSYFLAELTGASSEDCSACFMEFGKAQEEFTNYFSKKLEDLYFVGFEKSHAKAIQNYFKEQKVSLNFLDGKSSELNKLMSYETKRASLFGLFNILVISQKES